MRERIIFLGVGVLSLLPSAPSAQESEPWQLGVFVGEESGLSLYRKQNEGQSLELQGKFSVFPQPALLFAATFRAHVISLFETPAAQYPMSVGISGKAGVGLEGRGFLGGVSLPLGLVRESKSVTFFAEMAPGVVFLPDAVFDLDASVGLRFLW